jgi:hypothetical protein
LEDGAQAETVKPASAIIKPSTSELHLRFRCWACFHDVNPADPVAYVLSLNLHSRQPGLAKSSRRPQAQKEALAARTVQLFPSAV